MNVRAVLSLEFFKFQPFNDYEKEKKKQSKAKEKRICVSIIILTFLGSGNDLYRKFLPTQTQLKNRQCFSWYVT